jgi:cytochrome oxidase Cu insertion factor (SCO1/SenC/PrrC family)/thiol-disulfide isomerase/thioredoxin
LAAVRRHNAKLSLSLLCLTLAGCGLPLGADGAAPGRVLVLATRPAGQAAAGATLTSLSLESGGHWLSLLSRATAMDLRAAVAPEQVSVAEIPVAPGAYTRVRAATAAGVSELAVGLTVTAGDLQPLLLVVQANSVISDAYAGEDLNAGLQEAAGRYVRAPDFSLVDQDGRSVSLATFGGRPLLLASFDTRCTNSCPLITATLLQLEAQMRARGAADQFAIAEVSQDPTHDTPAVLRQYAAGIGVDWTLLTGPFSEVDTLLAALHLEVDRGPSQVIDHTAALFLIDGHGYIRKEFSGDARLQSLPPQLVALVSPEGRTRAVNGTWTVADVIGALDGVLGRAAPAAGAVKGPERNFTLPRLAGGGDVTLAATRGAPVLVDFWASYCGPCRQELPMLVSTAQARSATGLVLIGVDELEPASAGESFLHKLGVDMTAAADPDHAVGDAYGVYALPTAVFINSAGQISATVVGELDQQTLDLRLGEIGA